MTYRYPYWEIQSSMRGGDAVFEGWLRQVRRPRGFSEGTLAAPTAPSRVAQAIPRGVRPLDESDAMWQDEAPPRLEALMCRCWATDPHARPTAAEAAAELASIADDWVALLAAEGSAEAEGRLSFH